MKPHSSGRRLGLHQALPFTKIFVAQVATSVVGTVTLVEDSAIGLPMDEIYREELAGLREEARRIAEVSALAMDPLARAQGVGVLMRLLRMLLLYAAEVARLDDLFLAVNPRHVEFYEKFFDCRLFGTLKQYGKVNGAPSVTLRLDLHSVRDLITERHAAGVPACERHEFLYGTQNYRDVMLQPRQDLPDATLTSEQFAYFFAEHEALTAAPFASQAFVRPFFPNLGQARRGAAAWVPTVSPTRALAPALSSPNGPRRQTEGALMAPGAVAKAVGVETDSPERALHEAVSPRVPSLPISDDAVSAIVEAGLRAPSGDNCQPWRFRWDAAHVRVVLVPERADSFYDVAHAASWISLNAVLTNMTLAARDRGLRLAVELFPTDDSPQVVARGRLEPCAVRRDPLIAVIPARCVNRKPYWKNPLPGAVRDELHALGSSVPGVRLSLIETEPAKSRLAALAAQNDRFLFQHRGLHQGLYRWIRWTPDEIARSRDGMAVETLEQARSERPGIRLLESWSLARILAALGGSRLFSSRARRLYAHPGALVLLTVDGARPEDFVRGGEVLERIWLTATARGIALQPITRITFLLLRLSLAHGQGLSPRHRNVVERLEREFRRIVPAAGSDVPVMLFRLGLAAPPSARASRLAIETVLTVDNPHAGRLASIGHISADGSRRLA